MTSKDSQLIGVVSGPAGYIGNPDRTKDIYAPPDTFRHGMSLKTGSVYPLLVLLALAAVPILGDSFLFGEELSIQKILIGMALLAILMLFLQYALSALAMLPTLYTMRRYNASISHAWYWRQNRALRRTVPRPQDATEFDAYIDQAQKSDLHAETLAELERLKQSVARMKNHLKVNSFALEGYDTALLNLCQDIIDDQFE